MNSKNFRLLAVAAVTLCAALAAHATQPGNQGGGNGGCGVGQQTNGCGGTNNAPVATGGNASAGASAGAIGVGVGIGQGGAGGAGGSAIATGGAGGQGGKGGAGGSAVQGQQQGQAQSSRNTNRNTSTSSATGGQGGNGYAQSGGNVLTQQGGAVAVTVEGDKGSTYIAPAQERAPVATAYAAPLTSSPETCMGSSTGGAQGANFGVTFGTTWESVKCDRRMNARALQSLGLTKAAVALLCQDADVAKAMEAAGGSCPGADTAAAGKRAVAPAAALETASAPQYVDPIVRARLGLPPLK